MRIPRSLLDSIRGPALAATLAGCAGGEAAAVVIGPEPDRVAPVVVAALDPVAYDVAAETARLEALEDAGASAVARSDRRMENSDVAARRVAREGTLSTDWRHRSILAACGRG